MDEHKSYSVLMSVYKKESPEYLYSAIESMLNQSLPTDDFVIVCDGPLTTELDDVIEKARIRSDGVIKVVRLERNRGLGIALNEGMRHCRHDLVARMDSDDVSRPDRCRKQVEVFDCNGQIDIVSGTVEEFIGSTENVFARRMLPETQREILLFAKRRNPFNHPCVMYRKAAVEQAGGYQDFFRLEDYYLWVRMLQNGSEGYNIQEPLLWMRAGSEMYRRRSGLPYVRSIVALYDYMRETGFITHLEYVQIVVLRAVAALIPNWVREYLYRRFLRD